MKNAEPITLPLPQELVTMLRQSERDDSGLVFSGAEKSFRTVWENTCARMGRGNADGRRDAPSL